MVNRYSRADWQRLGVAVQAARLRHKDKGWDDMPGWADAVGRSTRILLGLERGERVGAKTLREVEALLGWADGHADEILRNPAADTAPDVPRPLGGEWAPLPHEPRDLDKFTVGDLLAEIETRFAELSFELHQTGHPALTTRLERVGGVTQERLEPMSPAEREAAEPDRGSGERPSDGTNDADQ